MTYVALVQQGIMLNQAVIAVSDDEAMIQSLADDSAAKLNVALKGFSEGWTAVVLPVP